MSFPNSAARLLYERLSAAPCAVHFLTLPDPVLFPDYYYFIRHPVALSDMARAMALGRYTLADMQRDVRRMISNAKKYNKPEAAVYQDSLELEVRSARGAARGARPPPRAPSALRRDARAGARARARSPSPSPPLPPPARHAPPREGD